MEIYLRPEGTCFQHDEPVNEDHSYYYITWVDLPVTYYAKEA